MSGRQGLWGLCSDLRVRSANREARLGKVGMVSNLKPSEY